MEGIGNSKGFFWGGGGQRPRKFQRGGGLDNKNHFQGLNFDLSTKIATYGSGRSFLKK